MHLHDIYPQVRGELERWAGYEILSRVMKRFDDLQVFLAGGAIRNYLLDVPATKDFDFFIGGSDHESALELLSEHGTMTETPYGSPRWSPPGSPDRHADVIPIADFAPGLWRCEDVVDVLNQFDFTASALAFDLRSGEAFDPQNGFRDLTRKVMRMVRFDYPEGPFIPGGSMSRNGVLWFRVLHYASALRLTIEPLTLQWLRDRRAFEDHADKFAAIFFPLHSGYLNPIQDGEL